MLTRFNLPLFNKLFGLLLQWWNSKSFQRYKNNLALQNWIWFHANNDCKRAASVESIDLVPWSILVKLSFFCNQQNAVRHNIAMNVLGLNLCSTILTVLECNYYKCI